jgi:hypothetical protein
MSLSEKETKVLVSLLRKLEWPIDPRVFLVLANKVITASIELAILDKTDRVLMHYRKDVEFNGYHMPGTVIRDNDENVPAAVRRLIATELRGTKMKISVPMCIGWAETQKGTGPYMNPYRHEIGLIHLARVQGAGIGEFFQLDALPPNTLPHHIKLVALVAAYIKEHPDF